MHFGVKWPHEDPDKPLSVKEAQRLFMAQFGQLDWVDFCGTPGFSEAWEAGEIARASVIAHGVLVRKNRLDKEPTAEQWAKISSNIQEQGRLHDAARSLVAQWARATGRTGKSHKQARQSRIRKLVKNGMQSDYAKRLKAEMSER